MSLLTRLRLTNRNIFRGYQVFLLAVVLRATWLVIGLHNHGTAFYYQTWEAYPTATIHEYQLYSPEVAKFWIPNDSQEYETLGFNIATGRGYTWLGEPATIRPPIYPIFLAVFYFLGLTNGWVMVVQILIWAIMALLIYRKYSRIGGYIVALDPTSIYFSTKLMAETVAAGLVFLAFWFQKRPRVSSFLIGLSAITKFHILPFAIIYPLRYLSHRREWLISLPIAIAPTVLFGLRNFYYYHYFGLTSLLGITYLCYAWCLYVGTPSMCAPGLLASLKLEKNPLAMSRQAMNKFITLVWQHPGYIVFHIREGILGLFRGRLDDIFQFRPLIGINAIWNLFILLGGINGALKLKQRVWILLPILTVLTAGPVFESRFQLIYLPVFAALFRLIP